MKKVSRNKSWNKIALVALVVLLFAFGVLLFLEKTKRTDLVKSPFNKPAGPTKEQKVNNDAKGDFLDSQYSNDSQQSSNNTQPSHSSATKMDLNARQEGSSVLITAKITGVTSGSCVLTVSNSGKTSSQTVDVIYQPEYSSCAGFGVPVSSVGAGTWNISLQVNGPDSNTATQQTSLEVK